MARGDSQSGIGTGLMVTGVVMLIAMFVLVAVMLFGYVFIGVSAPDGPADARPAVAE